MTCGDDKLTVCKPHRWFYDVLSGGGLEDWQRWYS